MVKLKRTARKATARVFFCGLLATAPQNGRWSGFRVSSTSGAVGFLSRSIRSLWTTISPLAWKAFSQPVMGQRPQIDLNISAFLIMSSKC